MSTPPSLADWLREQPFSLALSAGFFGFFAHTGLVLALEEAELVPEEITGSSAGALVAGLWAAGVPARRLAEEFAGLRRDHFWDPRLGFGLLAGEKFRAKVAALLPVERLEDTPRRCRIVVHDIFAGGPTALSHGPLATAIQASCAMPPLFHPVRLHGRLVTDGGASDREALSPLPSGTRAFYHHLVNRSPFHLPWRRQDVVLPSRPNLVALAISGLARLGPFALDRGPGVLAAAQAAARRALGAEVGDGRLHLRADA